MGTVWPRVAAQRGLAWGRLQGLHEALQMLTQSGASDTQARQRLIAMIQEAQALATSQSTSS